MNKKKLLVAALCGSCLCLVAYYFWADSRASTSFSGETEVTIDSQAYYKVTDVIDGDTFKASVDSRIIIVRVLGINTPETVDPRKPVECYGPEASAEGKSLLGGHSVRLALDLGREWHDKYGRYLLYAYRDDGLFYNDYMIRQGFAREYTVGSAYSLQAEFRKDQALAQVAKKGLWSACASSSAERHA